jgi:transcriptional regulator with XRE-family HTH domain
MTVAEALRAYRKSHGRTLQSISDRTGLTLAMLHRLERGQGSLLVLQRVADELGIVWRGLPAGGTIATRIRSARDRRGLSIEQVALRAGVGPRTVARMEDGNAQLRSVQKVLDLVAPSLGPKQRFAAIHDGRKDVRLTSGPFLADVRYVLLRRR